MKCAACGTDVTAESFAHAAHVARDMGAAIDAARAEGAAEERARIVAWLRSCAADHREYGLPLVADALIAYAGRIERDEPSKHAAERDEGRRMLGECYVLSGADTDGDGWEHTWKDAVAEVRTMREDRDEALEEARVDGVKLGIGAAADLVEGCSWGREVAWREVAAEIRAIDAGKIAVTEAP